MKTSIALLLMLSTPIVADDWHKYAVKPELMQLSHDVTYCMTKKTFDVKQGTEHSFAERFYKQCMRTHSGNQQYSRKFKRNTIGRFHYVLERLNELEHTMKA